MIRDPIFPPLRYEVDRLFDALVHTAWGTTPSAARWTPAVDVVEAPDRYRLEMDLPGVQAGDLSITAEGDRLLIEGGREPSPRRPSEHCPLAERPCGRFSRSFRLPPDADAGGVRVRLHEGVLTVEIPKTPARSLR